MFIASFVAVLGLSLAAGGVAPGPAEVPLYRKVEFPASPTPAGVKAYLVALESALRQDYEHHTNLPYVGGQVQVRTPAKDVLREVHEKFMAVPIDFLEDICKATSDTASPLFSQLSADALGARRDYRPGDRPILLRYLQRIPKLILVLDRMDWLDVTDPAIVAAWKKAKRDTTGGMLDTVGYRFAALAARRGLLDGLLTLANTARLRSELPPSPAGDAQLRADGEVLRQLVPSELPPAALAAFIVKQKSRLVFDPARRIYVDSSAGSPGSVRQER